MGKTKEERIIEKLTPVASTGSEALTIPNYSGVEGRRIPYKNIPIESIMPKTDSTTAIQIKQASGSSMVDFDTLNARVGIGLTNPSDKFEIQENVNEFGIRLKTTSTNNSRIIFQEATSDAIKIGYFPADNTFIISDELAGKDIITFTRTSLNVGINTSKSPATKLHLSGGALTIQNTIKPSTPTTAGAMFVSGGALYYIGSSGTVTSLGVA